MSDLLIDLSNYLTEVESITFEEAQEKILKMEPKEIEELIYTACFN